MPVESANVLTKTARNFRRLDTAIVSAQVDKNAC